MSKISAASRIAIIGAGHVGATAAYALMLRALVSEIILIDSNVPLAEAEAADIADANALARPARISAGTYGDAATATIAIITAGAATHGSESRLAVLSRSAVIVGECVTSLMAAGFAGTIIVAANPVDIMANVAFLKAGLPAHRVIGTGTLLDSGRLRQTLAEKLDVAPSAISGLVLGEHGDSEVAAFSTVRVGGVTLENFSSPGEAPDQDATAKEVREAGYRILAGKGYTSFGVATAIVRICEAIIRDERAVLPVSALLTGEFGITDLYLSLPCILGAEGVERVLVPDLSTAEQGALHRSAEVIRQAMANLEST
jgi:L-lactate dehydrogenase